MKKLPAGISLLLTCAGFAPAQTAAIPFFNDATVQVINITMAPSDFASLEANYLLDTYYQGAFTWNGITVSNVGIRSHGNASRSGIKPNLDINFAYYDKSQTFLDLPFVLLDANNEAPSNLQEWISMKLYRKMGVPAPREAPAQVFVNGQLLGFYFIIEHDDLTFVKRNYGENGGFLYEWEYTSVPYNFNNLGTLPTLYAPFLNLKSNQPIPDLQTFTNLVQLINQPLSATFTNDDFISALSQYLDPKQFLLYGAIGQVLMDQDGLLGGEIGMNNFDFYQFEGTTFYTFFAWDKELTFSSPTLDILSGVADPGIDPSAVNNDINLLAQRLYAIPEYQQYYLNAMVNTAAVMGGTGGWMDSEITNEYNIIYNAATNDPNKQCLGAAVLVPCGNAEFEASVNYMHAILATRQSFIDAEALADGYIPPTSGPQITSAGATAIGQSALQLSPGAIAIVAGSNLSTTSAQASTVPLPRTLGNTYVAVEGVRAPLFSTSAGTIEFQVPQDIPPGDANVVVSNNGDTSLTQDAAMLAATPFLLNAIHQNGSAVVAGNPVVAGEVLSVYALGLGVVAPDLPIGSSAPPSQETTTVSMAQAFLGAAPGGTTSVNVLFSGLVPGYVGLYELLLQMPQSLPSGALTQLNVSISGATTGIPLALQ